MKNGAGAGPSDPGAARVDGGLEHRLLKLGTTAERPVLNAARVLNAATVGSNATAPCFWALPVAPA